MSAGAGNALLRAQRLQTHAFENFFSVVTEGHEQVDLPAGVAVHGVHLQGAKSAFSLSGRVLLRF